METDYRSLFEEMTHAQLVEWALLLAADCERLRRELDKATNVIR
jgi:hypothetical protein